MDLFNNRSILYIIEGQKSEIYKKAKASLPNNAGIKLNLGCGNKHRLGYINLDIIDPCDLKHDLRRPLPFTDNSVDEIYSEGNVISLFSIDEWKNIKNEIVRVLKPGGKLVLVFLDADFILKQFLNDRTEKRWVWLDAIHGHQGAENEIAKNGFSPKKLAAELKEAGIEKVSWKAKIGNKWILPRKWIQLTGFKKNLLLGLALLTLIPRVIWIDLAYITADLFTDDYEPSTSLLSLLPKRKRKMFSGKTSFAITWQQT